MILRAAWAWPALLGLALSPWGTAAAQSAPPADINTDAKSAITACLTRISDAPTGLAELERRCPELASALQAARVRPLIIASSRDRLYRHSLLQLQGLLHPALGPAPPVSALTPFLQAAQGSRTAPRSWWQRLWDWLLERFAPKQQQNGSYSWLNKLLGALGGAQWLWMTLIWGTVIALPIAAIVMVVREVRAMGRRSTDEPVHGGETRTPGARDSRLALLRAMPLGQRPAQLFALLIARLVAAGRLPADRSLTHREVVRRAVLDDANQRRFIDALARVSERQLYSAAGTPPDDLEDLLAQGEDLYTTGWGRPAEH